ncbi:MAG: phosphatidylcholine/phosphatidylserine synthase [Alphaproteobacteria bacterium]|nr:phosphatidylcholine/phosphatidylserine synthase [Alphaproteobacteria bacterium]
MSIKKPQLKNLPVNTIIPNLVTLLALCAGFTSIRYSMQERWEAAIIAILLAALFDGLDGRVARLLRGTSKFGAELDSLADVVNFGVAPPIMVFLWAFGQDLAPELKAIRGIAWALALLYCSCMAIRLARFNAMLDEEPANPAWAYFFTGIPAPGGAFLVMFPILCNLTFGLDWIRSPIVACIFLGGVALLLVSRVPTLSMKKLQVKKVSVVPIMVGFVCMMAFLINEPWQTLTVFGFVYFASIPYTIYSFRKMTLEYTKKAKKPDVKTEKK